jgi:hypothetical protein
MKKTILFLFIFGLALILRVPETHATVLALSVNQNADNAGVIYWNTNMNANCLLRYSVTTDFGSSLGGTVQLIQTGSASNDGKFYFSGQLNNLAPGTDYYYHVICTTDDNQTVVSETKLTNLAAYDPKITPGTANITSENKGIIYWTTAINAQCTVDFSQDSGMNGGGSVFGQIVQTAASTNDGKYHFAAQLPNLTPNIDYYYQIICTALSSTNPDQTVGQSVTSDILNLPKYVQPSLTLNITKAGTGSGTVTDTNQALNCGNTCSLQYPKGTVVNLSASPASGSLFANWIGCGVGSVSSPTCTIQVTDTTNIAATFNVKPDLKVTNFKYSNGNVNDQNLATQIEFDLVNSGAYAADFYLVAWDNTTNYPLESTQFLPNQYSLAANQTVHVYLMNVNNISRLAAGSNLLTIKEVSLDSQTVYNSQDFTVVRIDGTSLNLVKIIYPNGGENYPQGEYVTVKWQGGKGIVQIGVTTKDASYSSTNGFTGLLGWIDTNNIPDGQKIWNGKTICDAQMGSCHDLSPGQYKIIVVSKSLNGNLIFGTDGPNGDTANYDLSNNYFTISSVTVNTQPVVTPTTDITTINSNASQLYNGTIDPLLAQINELRNTVKEQEVRIKYLENLVKNVQQVSDSALNAINNFITYGVDPNTKLLGAGQRAAVVNSFKAAFSKLPTTQTDLTDVVKIANGRWPGQTSAAAEAAAKAQFQKVYLRAPIMSNRNDNAAITIMAYGLQQQAKNRNLKSEVVGINTFKYVFHRLPASAQDWNTVGAITYSGAKR